MQGSGDGDGAATRLRESMAAVAGDPGFDAALQDYAAAITRLYRARPEAVAIIGNVARFGIAAALLVAEHPASTREIAERLIGPGVASRTRVAGHVRRLAQLAAVLPAGGGRGGGQRWQLAPFVAGLLHDWMRAVATPAGRWRASRHDLDDVAVLRRYLADVLESSRGGRDIFAPFPRIGRLMRLAAGHALLMEMLLATGAVPEQSFTLSRLGFARDYGISRSHLQDMIAMLVVDGSLIRHAGGALALSPQLAGEVRAWAASLFVVANATLAGELLAVLPKLR